MFKILFYLIVNFKNDVILLIYYVIINFIFIVEGIVYKNLNDFE